MNIIEKIKDSDMFFLLAGPCVIEGEEMALKIAEHVSELTNRWGIPYVFKGSFKKANRSRLDSFTGIGDVKALEILAKVRKEFQIPVVTDVHSPEDAVLAAEYVDVLPTDRFVGGGSPYGACCECEERAVSFSGGDAFCCGEGAGIE